MIFGFILIILKFLTFYTKLPEYLPQVAHTTRSVSEYFPKNSSSLNFFM